MENVLCSFYSYPNLFSITAHLSILLQKLIYCNLHIWKIISTFHKFIKKIFYQLLILVAFSSFYIYYNGYKDFVDSKNFLLYKEVFLLFAESLIFRTLTVSSLIIPIM